MIHNAGMPDLAAHGSYTWDDFVDLDEDDLRELIDGELVEIEVPNRPHESVVALLGYFLIAWARAGNGGEALASGYKVRISERRGVMPDVQFYRRENDSAKRQHKGLVEGRPDLAVEIVSPSSRKHDRVTKLNWYASREVPEYWIVDPEARTLEQLVLANGAYTIVQSLAEETVFEPRTFPGLAIPLAELWGDPTSP
jgi:Uma2 family endonuclease